MNKNLIWFDHPAREWVDGLPIGNGRIGTLVPGYAARELLCLNHEGIWHATEAADRTTVPVAQWLPEIRKLALAGKWKQADDLLLTKLQPTNRIVKAMAEHQPAGNLGIYFPCPQPAEDYRRSLDLATGIARVNYRIGPTHYERRYFASAVHDLIVIEIEANAPGAVSCNPYLETLDEMHRFLNPLLRQGLPDCEYQHHTDGDTIGFTTHYQGGMSWAVGLRAVADGGLIGLDRTGGLLIENANKLTLLVSIITSEQSPDPRALCQQRLAAVRAVAGLAAASTAEHRGFFDRVALTLGDPAADQPTDELLHATYRGRSPHHLFELIFQMGRYLMLASSRPGTKAITLQGIWNKDLHAAWENDWHLDLNVQMSYWIAEVGNLSECHEPLFDMIEGLVPDAEKNARDIFGCRGVLFPLSFAGKGVVLPGHGIVHPGVAGWLAQHLWTHYEYTRDQAFLRQRAYPFMKRVAEFYQDYLFKDERGQYVILPSASPEHSPANWESGMCLNATFDLAIIQELMRNLLTASETLGVDADLRAAWRDIREHLPDWPLDAEGALREWADDNAGPDDHHRHISHLYPVFPGDLFTPEETPELMQAASKALAKRESLLNRGLQVSTKLPYPYQRVSGREHLAGWTPPKMAIMHARLGEGDKALESLKFLARGFMAENLLTYSVDWRAQGFTDYPPAVAAYAYPWLFQIEAILGASAAIAEMLLQSQHGILRILPALPAEWSAGSVQGLRARGGFEVGIAWENNTPTTIGIKSLLGNTCRLKLYAPDKSIEVCCQRQPIAVDHQPDGSFSFPTEKDQTYTIAVHSAGR